jgi:hypothetical protein
MRGAKPGAAQASPAVENNQNKGKDAFDRFDPSDWAWEFLRRNPHYCADWRAAAPRALPHVTLADGTVLLRLRRRYPRAERWGLHAFADPACAAGDGSIFWLPCVFRRTVRARCKQVASLAQARTFTLAEFAGRRFAVIGVDGIPVVTLKGEGISVALAAHGWHVLTRPATITFELDAFHDIGTQAECVRDLQRLAEARDSPTIGRSPWSVDERLRHALIALDGSLAGKSYRDIAIMIFGDQRVAEDWNGASRFMKDRVRRLVAKAHELMDGGYRALLR